jgi:hypothetical protein
MTCFDSRALNQPTGAHLTVTWEVLARARAICTPVTRRRVSPAPMCRQLPQPRVPQPRDMSALFDMLVRMPVYTPLAVLTLSRWRRDCVTRDAI